MPRSHAYLGRRVQTSAHEWAIEHVRVISDAEFEHAQQVHVELRSFIQGDLLPYVEFATTQYSATMEYVRSKDDPQFVAPSDAFALKCGLLTFLSALVMHKEQTRMKMIHRARNDPARARAASLDSNYYDQSFSYRFCVRLRNFILHRSPDVIDIDVSKGGVRPSGLIVPRTDVLVSAKRDVLLDKDEHGDVWSVVRREIESMDEKIDLTPLVLEAANVARQYAARARLLLYPAISRSISDLRGWRAELGDLSRALPVMVRMPDVDQFVSHEESRVNVLTLRFDLAERARSLLLEARQA